MSVRECRKIKLYHILGMICLIGMACMGCSRSRDSGTDVAVMQTEERVFEENISEEGETEEDASEANAVHIAIAASASIHFPEKLECSDGSVIYMTNYGNSALGTDRELIAACQLGTISMVSSDPISHIGTIPEIALLDIPYLYDTPEEWQDALENKLFDCFQPYYNAHGLQLIAWKSWYCRSLLSRIRLERVEQFSELQMRVLENEYLQNYWESMGIHTVQLPFDSFIYALNQNQINIADAGPRSLYHAGVLPTMQYEIEVEYIPSVSGIVMNLDEYNQLTPAQQEVLGKLTDYQSADHNQADQYLNECGVEKIPVSKELKDYLKEHQIVVIEELKEDLGDEIVDEFLEMARQ